MSSAKKPDVTNADSPANFEQQLQELEAIVKQLESGDLSLEESLQHYEQGMKLSQQSQKALEQASQRIDKFNPDSQQNEPFTLTQSDSDNS